MITKHMPMFHRWVFLLLLLLSLTRTSGDASSRSRGEWVSSFLTAHQHIIGHSVPGIDCRIVLRKSMVTNAVLAKSFDHVNLKHIDSKPSPPTVQIRDREGVKTEADGKFMHRLQFVGLSCAVCRYRWYRGIGATVLQARQMYWYTTNHDMLQRPWYADTFYAVDEQQN